MTEPHPEPPKDQAPQPMIAEVEELLETEITETIAAALLYDVAHGAETGHPGLTRLYTMERM